MLAGRQKEFERLRGPLDLTGSGPEFPQWDGMASALAAASDITGRRTSPELEHAGWMLSANV